MIRLLVVAALVLVIAAGTAAHRARQRRLQHQPTGQRLPAELRAATERTWILFSTPWCATCGPAEQRLRAADPAATVTRVDATERPDLAGALHIETAPTVLLAGPDGAVRRRLAGVDAVQAYLRELAPAVDAAAHQLAVGNDDAVGVSRSLQLHLDVPLEDVDLVADMLLDAGASAVEQRDLDGARATLIADPDAARLGPIEERWEPRWVPVDDAVLDRWRDWAVPVRVGRIVLVPSWLDPPATSAADLVLTLDPGRTFGSGSHPSTRLALAALARHLRPGDRVLDLGSGSGVLAVAAALLGAGSTTAVDTDPAAERATAENARRNGVAVEVVPAAHPADLIVANIGAAALIELAPTIDARTVILSGILAAQGDEVVAAYAAHYIERERPQEDGWVAPVLQRRSTITPSPGARCRP